jgi:hypothetical protein
MKELKDIVCSLELAKELKENGFKQESLFKWCEWDKTDEFYDNEKNRVFSQEQWENYATDYNPPNSVFYSSPTATELLNELPEVVVVENKVHSFWCNKIDGLYRCGYDENCYEEYGFQEDENSMANAMAKLYLELKKEGLL